MTAARTRIDEDRFEAFGAAFFLSLWSGLRLDNRVPSLPPRGLKFYTGLFMGFLFIACFPLMLAFAIVTPIALVLLPILLIGSLILMRPPRPK